MASGKQKFPGEISHSGYSQIKSALSDFLVLKFTKFTLPKLYEYEEVVFSNGIIPC